MTGATGDAVHHYEVEVVARRCDGPTARRVRRLGAALSDRSFGFLPAPSVGDLVIRRRGSGLELLRRGAGGAHEAAGLLARARADLLTQSVEDFARQWGLSPLP